MAAVIFPNPNATNPETGEPYSAGWTADNGVTYIYEDNSWKAQSLAGPAADDKYVNVDGDNMTGNLTLGGDKITLDATNGNIVAGGLDPASSGTVTILTSEDSGTRGRIQISSDGTNSGAPFINAGTAPTFDNKFVVRNDGSASFAGGDITLNADGSAIFANKIDIGPNAASENEDPTLTIGSDNRRGILHIKSTLGSYLEGAINFSNPDTGVTFIARASGDMYLGGDLSDGENLNANISLNATDGSATFTNRVTTPQIFGAVTNSTAADYRVLNVYNTDLTQPAAYKASIFADGSATFKEITLKTGEATALTIKDATDATKTQLNSDGYAYFDSLVEVKELAAGTGNTGLNGSVLSSLDETGFYTNYVDAGRGPAVFPHGTSGATGRNLEIFGGLQINTEPDNPANYTTTTDSEGNETQVYNGPTLDVKDRLTKTQTALTALKAAALDNATDLAGLKAAIVTALADI